MTKEFEKAGFPSVMYLLHKYDALSGADYDEFINQDIPPWQISDDTCGPQADPPADFAMFFAAVFSTADDTGAQFRRLLRGQEPEGAAVWLPRLASVASVRWAFFVPEEPTVPSLMHEEDEHGDLVLMPPGSPHAPGGGRGAVSAKQLRFIITFLRDFQFRWLLFSYQDTFVHVGQLYNNLAQLDPPMRTALGGWRPELQGNVADAPLWLPPHFFAITHDVHHLLASHRVARWLRAEDEEGMGAAINSWLSPLTIRRASLAGVYVGREGAMCPEDAVVLHPVSPLELVLLSQASMEGPPCSVLNASGV